MSQVQAGQAAGPVVSPGNIVMSGVGFSLGAAAGAERIDQAFFDKKLQRLHAEGKTLWQPTDHVDALASRTLRQSSVARGGLVVGAGLVGAAILGLPDAEHRPWVPIAVGGTILGAGIVGGIGFGVQRAIGEGKWYKLPTRVGVGVGAGLAAGLALGTVATVVSGLGGNMSTVVDAMFGIE